MHDRVWPLVLTIGIFCGMVLSGPLASKARAQTPPALAMSVKIQGSGWLDAVPAGIPWLAHDDPVKPALWGAYNSKKAARGTVRIGPWRPCRDFKLAVAGFPLTMGNGLYLRRRQDGAQYPLIDFNPGPRWREIDVHLPPDWVGKPVELTLIALADPNYPDIGWIGMSEPYTRNSAGTVQPVFRRRVLPADWGLWRSLGLIILLHSVSFLVVGLSLVPVWRRLARVPDAVVPLLSVAGFSVVAFAVFYAFFFSPQWGRISEWIVYATAIAGLLISVRIYRGRIWRIWGGGEMVCVLILISLALMFYFGTMYVTQSAAEYSSLAGRRAIPGALPSDNVFTEIIAEVMIRGDDPRQQLGAWHVSDRPPLQSGVQLLCWGPTAFLDPDDARFAMQLSGVLFQTTWVSGVWAMLRMAGLTRKRAAQICLALIPSGFLYLNTIFIWPKLSAAGFSLGVLSLILSGSHRSIGGYVIAGMMAALAMLSHGGAFFFLLPCMVLTLLSSKWPGWKPALAGCLTAIVLYAPWTAYQQCYDPPGDALLKWHLAGVQTVDKRPAWTVVREAYRNSTPRQLLHNRMANVATLFRGDWSLLLQFDPQSILAKRTDIFFHFFRSIGLFNLGWLLLPFALADKTWRKHWEIILAAGLLGVVFWCLAMFVPGATVIHQGASAGFLALMIIAVAALRQQSRDVFVLLALANAALFLADYLPCPNEVLIASEGHLDWLAILLVATALVLGLLLVTNRWVVRTLLDASRQENLPLAGPTAHFERVWCKP